MSVNSFPRRPREWMWAGLVMAVAFLTIGATLIFQTDRYNNTPSYGILLDVLPAIAWGAMYLVAGGLLALYVWKWRSQPFSIVAHTAAATLSMVWLSAFVIRYITDPGTTIVNVVSWSVYTLLVLRSSVSRPNDVPPAPLAVHVPGVRPCPSCAGTGVDIRPGGHG